MSFDSRPLLPRPLPDPDYLRHLRANALARLQQEEQTIARRSVMQRMALVFAGLPLLRTRPARAAGPRCSAPQYGAPGLPGNPRLPQPTAFVSRNDLASLASWPSSSVILLAEDTPRSSIYQTHPSRTAYYLLPSGTPLSLNLINISSSSFIVNGPEALYVSYAGELYGAKFLADEVVLIPSLFKTPTPPTGDGAVISRFTAMVNDEAIEKLSSPSRNIHIRISNAPWSSWGIHSASIANGILQIEGIAIDLKTRQLVAKPR